MAELVRITRPGGWIVVIDTDWGLHAIHGADPTLTAAVVERWARNAANGLAGRQLPRSSPTPGCEPRSSSPIP